ncbi:ribosome-associated GTPase EngA [Candidatus Termititenax persephonae]|uniref:GTPase Der n=1 Tax=Candidatus Termititenax persephonae TaxID=2218525 RepID=A0A388THU9_9BACT|nr:ribosome-associated GTPase EngA [Candidatus Termititenax persephonae]
MAKPKVVAIVGRPNVGKSSLANKIIGRREAIVHNAPGVTRDRKYLAAEWAGCQFTVIDTGGIYNDDTLNRSLDFQKDIEEQVAVALQEADLIIMVADGKIGLHHLDQAVALLLRRSGRKVLLAVNKMETNKRDLNLYEFYNLGLEKVFAVSAITGGGVADLLDAAVAELKIKPGLAQPSTAIRVAIVGRPNVGKSSLLNALLGRERSIVSPLAGTTRDAIDEEISRAKTIFRFVDTAGIRKKARVNEDIEYYAVQRAINAIENCDIALLMLDATRLVEEQDQKIAGLIDSNNKGCLLLVNKWDLIEKDGATINAYTAAIRRKLKFLAYAPLLFISAQENIRTFDIYQNISAIYQNFQFQSTTGQLNKAVAALLQRHPPRAHKGRQLKIYYAVQTGRRPPTFTFHCNNAKLLHFAYARYIENQLREHYALSGVPLKLFFQGKARK